jgi:hypothetical protein
MDPAATTATAPAAGSVPKNQAKLRKLAKDMTPDERKVEYENPACQREAAKNRVSSTLMTKASALATLQAMAWRLLAVSPASRSQGFQGRQRPPGRSLGIPRDLQGAHDEERRGH